MKRLLMVFLLIMVSNIGLIKARAEGPSVDLVAMFSKTPDVTVNGVKLKTIFKVSFGKGKISDVYNQIYYGRYAPNQIVCRANWIADSETEGGKLVLNQLVSWSVWYRPGLMVSEDAQCVDTSTSPRVTTSWYNQGYRSIGSGTEPHMSLTWVGQMIDIKKVGKGTKWCKAASFAYASFNGVDYSWGKTPLKKAVFQLTPALEKWALTSRDIECTSDVKTYDTWLRTPGWSFVNIK